MDNLQAFLSPETPSLKICGVTSLDDAEQLVTAQVPALGINFWPHSKRYCPPEAASAILTPLQDRIVRVGVFVNNARELTPSLLAKRKLDIIQLHGDEDDSELRSFLEEGVPVIRSLALSTGADLTEVASHYQELASQTGGTLSLLLDAHAPGLYGGTGKTIDWEQAATFIKLAAPLPVLLAGGIVPNNAEEAIRIAQPAGLDVASGGESAPGVKNFEKVAALLAATQTLPAS